MDLHRLIPAAARVVELAGVAMLLLGALLALGVFVAHVARGRPFAAVYDDLRANLGRAMLLGLEFLVIADIIGTVAVEPTLANLAVLAVIVAIRAPSSISAISPKCSPSANVPRGAPSIVTVASPDSMT